MQEQPITSPTLPGTVTLTPETDLERVGRWVTSIVGGLLLIGTGLVVWLWWPVLKWEVRRYEPWRLFLLHIGDAGSLLLCLHWLATHITGRKPVRHERWPKRAITSREVAAILMLFGAWGVDYAVTRNVVLTEETCFEVGRKVVATAYAGWEPGHLRFSERILLVEFADETGKLHRARLMVEGSGSYTPPDRAAPNLYGNLPLTFPCRVAIRYDRAWPDRCWVDTSFEGRGGEYLRMSHAFSLLQLVIVVLVGPLLILAPFDLQRVLPFAVEVFFMVIAGAIDPSLRLG